MLSGMHRGSWDTLLGGGEAESSVSSTSHVCLCLSPSWRPDRWLAAATSSLLHSALRGHRQCSDTAHSSRECTAASPTCQWRLPRTPIRLPCLHQGVQQAGMSVCRARACRAWMLRNAEGGTSSGRHAQTYTRESG